MVSEPELPVVVLHWRSPDDALRAVRSLNRSRGVRPRVLVVENGSEDGSRARLKEQLAGEAELLELPENRGYAGGMNAGIRWWEARSPASFLLLVTQDVTVDQDTLCRLVQAGESRPGLGAVAPVTWLAEPPDRIFSAGGWLDSNRLRFGHHRTLPEDGPVPGPGSAPEDGPEPVRPVEWLDGCCLLLRREALRDVGLLDERYFLYLEEVDLCRRLTRGGWGVAVATRARARQDRPPVPGRHYAYYMARNQYLFWRDHEGASTLRVAARLTGGVLRLGAWTLRGPKVGKPSGGPDRVPLGLRLRRLRDGIAGLVTGTVDHLRRRTGPGGPPPPEDPAPRPRSLPPSSP